MKEQIFIKFNCFKNFNRFSIFRLIQAVLIFCDQVAIIAESADIEVTSVCPKSYPYKLTLNHA